MLLGSERGGKASRRAASRPVKVRCHSNGCAGELPLAVGKPKHTAVVHGAMRRAASPPGGSPGGIPPQ